MFGILYTIERVDNHQQVAHMVLHQNNYIKDHFSIMRVIQGTLIRWLKCVCFTDMCNVTEVIQSTNRFD